MRKRGGDFGESDDLAGMAQKKENNGYNKKTREPEIDSGARCGAGEDIGGDQKKYNVCEPEPVVRQVGHARGGAHEQGQETDRQASVSYCCANAAGHADHTVLLAASDCESKRVLVLTVQSGHHRNAVHRHAAPLPLQARAAAAVQDMLSWRQTRAIQGELRV